MANQVRRPVDILVDQNDDFEIEIVEPTDNELQLRGLSQRDFESILEMDNLRWS